MTELSLMRFCDAQIRLITRLVFENEPDGQKPRVNARIGLLIPELVAVCDTSREALETLRNALVLRVIKQTYPIAKVARVLVPNMISLLEGLRRHFRQMSKEAPPVERLDDFEAALNRFRESAVLFLLRWPWLDPDEIKEFEATFEQGNYQDAREALNELLHQAREGAQGKDRLLATVPTPPR